MNEALHLKLYLVMKHIDREISYLVEVLLIHGKKEKVVTVELNDKIKIKGWLQRAKRM